MTKITCRITVAAIVAPLAFLAGYGAANASPLPHRCYAQNLALHLSQPTGAAGTTYYHLTFRNKGTACTLYGYPGISAAESAAGPEVGPPAGRSAGRSVLVTLKHGGSAWAMLGVANTSNYPPAKCGARTAAGLRVYAPGAFDGWFVKLRVSVCTLARSMSVSPVRVGA